MRRIGTAALLLTTLLLGGTAAQDTKETKDVKDSSEERRRAELKGLEGAWRVVGVRRAGRETPAETLQRVPLKVYVNGDRKTLTYRVKGSVEARATFEIEEIDDRWAIDTMDSKDHLERGIFKLIQPRWFIDARTLMICTTPPGQDRPASFVSDDKIKTTIILLHPVRWWN